MSFGALGQYALGQINPRVSYSVQGDAGSFAVAGQDAGLTHYVPNTYRLSALGEVALGQLNSIPSAGAYSVLADFAVFSLTGQNVGSVMRGEAGSFTLTGQAASLVSTRALVSDAGSFVLTGEDAGLRAGEPPGVYVLTGQDAWLQHHHILYGDAATFTLTGQSAGLAVSMPGDVGAFVLTGQSVGITAVRVLYAQPHITQSYTGHVLFAALGQVALGGSVSVDAGAQTTFTLTSQNLILRRGYSVPADAGSFVWTGYGADLEAIRIIYPETGVFTLTGQAGLGIITMPGLAGTFSLTGQDAFFNRRRRRIRGNLRVGPGSGITGRPSVGQAITARAA